MPANIVATVYIHLALIAGAAYSFIFFTKQELIPCVLVWSLVTATAFLSGQFWLLVLVLFLGSMHLLKNHRHNILVYYFIALPALPLNMDYGIPSPFPGTRHILIINYFRILSIFLLLPLFVKFAQDCYFSKLYHLKKIRFMESSSDFLVISYSLLLFLLTFRDEPSLTSALKNIFYIFLVIPIPYFVISRTAGTINDFKKIFSAILLVAVILSFIAYLQVALDWNIYNVLHYYLGMDADRLVFSKHYRSGFMRVEGSMEHPIAFGYFMTLALGILLVLKKQIQIKNIPFAITFLLFIGVLFLTGSRGAWLASFFLIFLFWVLSKINYNFLSIYITSGLLFLISIGAIAKKFLPLLDPYGTFDYRISLIQNSLTIIRSNLWLGSASYRETSEMEGLRQGQGIIDIVNTYIQVALESGVIGLSLFILIFMVLIYKISKYLKGLSHKDAGADGGEYFYLGIYLMAALLSTMLFIGTTSSLGNISIYYWALIGMSSAYLRLLKNYTAAAG